MSRLGFVCLILAGCLMTAVRAEVPATEPEHPEWSSSFRGKELEAQYLHRLIDDAKARGEALDPKWISRLSELEPLGRMETPASLPPAPTPNEQRSVEPFRLRGNPLDQGADYCPATIISSLPYYDSGTTAGLRNDYWCGQVDYGNPDVIYQFTPAYTTSYLITVTSDFYPAVYVWTSGSCPGYSLVSCSDTYCPYGSGDPTLQILLNAGQTYWIILDGAGGADDYGAYELHVNYNSVSGIICDPDVLGEPPGSFSGNTCNAISHCALRPSNDQVIMVHVPVSSSWRFSLCSGNYLWDSYMYLTDAPCGGNILASNDDHCALLSQFDACLTRNWYYVIVEGSGSADCGPFTLTVSQVHGACCYGDSTNPQCQDWTSICDCQALGGTWLYGQNCDTTWCGPRPTCQDDANLGQLPFLATETWDAYWADDNSTFHEYENYAVTRPVSAVRFWGATAQGDLTPCVEQPQNVRVSFHADSSGRPRLANPVAQYSLTLSGTFIGTYTLAGHNFAVYQYDAVLPVPCAQTSGWFSVTGEAVGGTPGCNLFWITSPQGDHLFCQQHNASLSLITTENLSFCLAGQPPCASYLEPPHWLTCYPVTINGDHHIQLSWYAYSQGVYEFWSTTSPNNDQNPDGGLDSMWHREATVIVRDTLGAQTWTDPNPISGLYKNYVGIQVCRPVNDECSNAIPVSNGLTNYSNIGADSDGPPPASCANLGSDVWFSYTAVCTGTLTVNTCTGTNFDTGIEIFSGSCGNLGNPLACNDNFCGVQSQVTFAATAGSNYLIRVGGFGGNQGSGELNISCQ